MMTFVEAVRNGMAKLEDLADYIELWLTTETGMSLIEVLGITEEQYALWLSDPSTTALWVK